MLIKTILSRPTINSHYVVINTFPSGISPFILHMLIMCLKKPSILLKRPENLSDKQSGRLEELVKVNLSSIKAYLLKEDFQEFWSMRYKSWAGKFLEDWADMTMESELKPMQKVAKMLRSHKELILNWFSVPGGLSSGPVEGLNNKAKLTIKKAYGFKTLDCLQIGLYHQLGRLEEPPPTHRFC